MALVKAQVGQTVRVLVEGFGRNEGTLSGRLDNNLTVEFKADPASWVAMRWCASRRPCHRPAGRTFGIILIFWIHYPNI